MCSKCPPRSTFAKVIAKINVAPFWDIVYIALLYSYSLQFHFGSYVFASQGLRLGRVSSKEIYQFFRPCHITHPAKLALVVNNGVINASMKCVFIAAGAATMHDDAFKSYSIHSFHLLPYRNRHLCMIIVVSILRNKKLSCRREAARYSVVPVPVLPKM